MGITGYIVLLALAFLGMGNVFVLFIPAFLIFSTNGLLSILTTVFLANTVDYGELKNGSRDESVIFSMQTFVVKLASGIAAFIASICLSLNHLQSGTEVSEADKLVDWSLNVTASARTGLRLTMAVVPIIGLLVAIFWFRKKFFLTDEAVEKMSVTKQLPQRGSGK
jgi:melibiose permease